MNVRVLRMPVSGECKDDPFLDCNSTCTAFWFWWTSLQLRLFPQSPAGLQFYSKMTSSKWRMLTKVLGAVVLLIILSPFLQPLQAAKKGKGKPSKRDEKDDRVCKSLMKGSSSNAKMNVLLCGLVSTSFLLITKDFYVYDLPASAIRGDDNSSKIFLGEAKPLKLEEKWPILASNLNFKEIRHAIYNAFTVMDDTSEYLLFITWSQTDPELVGVTYDLKKNKVMPRKHSYRFNGKVKQVMLSASKKMLFYGLRDKDESGKKGLQIAEFKFNGRNLYSSSGMKRTGAWMAICGNGKGEMHLSKGKTSKCDPVEWRNVIKGFIDGDQVYLFGTQYIYIFDLDAVTGPGKVVPISKKRYDEFLLCHYDYLKWAIIALALLFLLLFLLILLWLCCCRGRRKKGGGTGTGTKSKKHKKSKSNKRKSYKSMTNAVTRRSRGGTKKTLKSKGKSKSSKGKSKYKSHFNDATGRSVFKQKNK